jgi:hypothetical protein
MVMGSFNQVDHLVNDDVLEAIPGLLGELRIQTDSVNQGIAAPPLGLHLLHVETADLDIKARLPSLDQRCYSRLEGLSIPERQGLFTA